METRERVLLRDLARQVAELACLPAMAQRRELWCRHNRMQARRPVVYIDPQGSWGELVPETALRCQDHVARDVERQLRRQLFLGHQLDSDNVIESEWVVPRIIHSSGWGLRPRRRPSTTERGAFGFDPVITQPGDLRQLRFPDITPDEAATRQRQEWFVDLFGDLLSVRLRGVADLSYHLMNQYTALRGLEEVLLDMVQHPQSVHDAMAFLEAGHRHLLRQYEQLGLLSLNNDSTPIYTSGYGYTDELPRPGAPAGSVRPEDMWGWAEAQEMAVVSPRMHAEFVFPYEARLLTRFGLNGYGCCDDVTDKLDFVLTLPRLRRVSVSPWADVERCAARIGRQCIFMWKPQPAHLVGRFDGAMVEDYLQRTVTAAQVYGCTLEIVLLDTHTCEGHPERFVDWSRIARRVVEAGEANAPKPTF
jgi:hypothetical protein